MPETKKPDYRSTPDVNSKYPGTGNEIRPRRGSIGSIILSDARRRLKRLYPMILEDSETKKHKELRFEIISII